MIISGVRPAVLITLIVAAIVLAGLFGKHQKNHSPPPPMTSTPSVYQRICQQCHGAAGEGNASLRTPSIAGQPAWYLNEQLNKFRGGHRGTEPRDPLGQQMRAIAISLSGSELAEATATIASFPSQPTRATIEGNLAHGRQLYEEQCIECHRYNGAGEKVFGSSPLTGFQDWYLAAQIDKFRLGIRGYHPEDEKGAQMRHLLSYLGEGDAEDLAAYIAHLAERYPPKSR